jgi:hypothetical protein
MTSAHHHRPAPKPRIKTISLAVALEELRQPGHELVSLHLPPPEGGHGFFVVPGGGRVKAEDAERILQYGCPVETLRKALARDSHGRASGPLGCALDMIAASDGGRR